MAFPKNPVLIDPAQVEFIVHRLADMRHNVNNHLSLIAAAAEIAMRKPDMLERMMNTLTEQPHKITQEIRKFSDELESLLGLPPEDQEKQ